MGVWDSIKGGVGAAWDQTGGRAWDAHQRANEDERILGLNPDKGLYQGLEGVADFARGLPDFAKGYADLVFDTSPSGVAWNLNNYLKGQWAPTEPDPIISGPTIYGPGVTDPTPEQIAAAAAAELGAAWQPQHDADFGGLTTNPPAPTPFARPEFDPSGITGPYGTYSDALDDNYNNYVSILEGLSTGPRTSRIEEMYSLATEEAARLSGAADAYGLTQGERITNDAKAMYERLGGLTADFETELQLIREDQSSRLGVSREVRNARIDEAAEGLGDAAATFLVSATASSDILDAQGNRQQVHSDRMDRLYAGWSLDNAMRAVGLEKSERRDLADRVLALKENAKKMRYDEGQKRLERLYAAEESAADREFDMATTLADMGYTHGANLAEIGLQGALGVSEAEEAFDSQWDRAEAYWENPVTANAFAGMDPSMMGGADPSEFVDYWLAIQQMQADAGGAGDDVGPLWQDPIYGLPWADLYSYDPVSGQYIPNAQAIEQVSDPLGMAPSELTGRLAGDMAGLNSAGT